jgi:hypothetical protein
LQSDPLGLGGGLNTYVYVFGSPLVRSDSLGLAPSCFTTFFGYECSNTAGEGSTVGTGVYAQYCAGASGSVGGYTSSGSQVGVNVGCGPTGGVFLGSPTAFSGPSSTASASFGGASFTGSWNSNGAGIACSPSLIPGVSYGSSNTTTYPVTITFPGGFGFSGWKGGVPPLDNPPVAPSVPGPAIGPGTPGIPRVPGPGIPGPSSPEF